MTEHTVKSFDPDLTLVRAKISEMGGIAEELLADALRSVQARDAALADTVIERDKRLDALELEVEQMTARLIALRQPMAQDLRLLIVALKTSSTLERIGDLSKNIARRSVHLTKAPPTSVAAAIVSMGRDVLGELSSVLDAWARRDLDQAMAVWRRDAQIDEAYNALFRVVVTYMMEDARTISIGSQLLFIAKNLERIGDHSTHIAEMIHYMEVGTLLEDERPKGEPSGYEIV